MCVYPLPIRPPTAHATFTAAPLTVPELTLQAVSLWSVPFFQAGDVFPSPDQWQECLRDLQAIPPPARWWLQWSGRPIVMLFNHPCTTFPAYFDVVGKPIPGRADGGTYDTALGLGWPVPVFDIIRSFPATSQGVAHAGTSVPCHEVGHTMDALLNGARGADGTPWLSTQRQWQSLWSSVTWWSRLLATNAAEAWAESFACWCMKRTDWGWTRLPPNVDPRLYAYFDAMAAAANWQLDPTPA